MIDYPNPYKTSLSSSSPEGLQNQETWQNLDDLKKQRQEMIDHPNPAALADELAAEIGRLKAEARHACCEGCEMTDREMLELAAKAMQRLRVPDFANFDVLEDGSAICLHAGSFRGAMTCYWNPLKNPGAALQMAATLKIDVMHTSIHSPQVHAFGLGVACTEEKGNDPVAATCRAITRAAAEIGRTMK